MTSATPTKACVPCRIRKTKCDAAAAGLPCGGCVSRNCAEKCTIVTRKRRRRPGEIADEAGAGAAASTVVLSRQCLNTNTDKPQAPPPPAALLAWSHSPENLSRQAPGSDKRPSQSQLHYFHILKEAVDDGALDEKDDKTGTPFDPDDDDQPWHKAPQLDDIDKEYLTKKRLFDLPPKPCLITFLTSYFTTQDQYSPIIDKTDFVHKFETGTCSLFLLYSILANASLYVPRETIEACGFVDRSEAQATFASRATLIHDFQVESDVLAFLQGSLLMTKVLPEQPVDKDFNYWFYNALRLATKLQLYSHLNQTGKQDRNSRLYSRIAWALYGRHIFHLVSEFRNAAYLHGLPAMEAPKMSDWDTERISREYQEIVPPTTTQQKALFIAICKIGAIYGEVLSSIVQEPRVDLAQLLRPLDFWRMSLATQLQLGEQPPNTNIHYLDLLGTSYRYEATLCRLIQRQLRSVDPPKSNSAKHRLRSSMLELDGITGKLLANGFMDKVPISLMTAIPALLALHLEAALDPEEPELVRSMSRISISQAMLALHQLREIPAIKKAIPLFELILTRKRLYDGPAGATLPWQESNGNGDSTIQRAQLSAGLHDTPGESFDSFLQEFLEDDTLGKWDFGQVDFSRLV